MRWGFSAAAAALLLAGAGVRAEAQDAEPEHTKFALKVSMFRPTQGGLINSAGRYWWGFGFDFFPKYAAGAGKSTIYFGIDYFWRGDGGQNTFSMPILAKYRYYLSQVGGRPRTYVGVGGGLYVVNAKNLSATVQPGLRGFIGVDLNRKLFLELNYDYVSGFSNNLGVPLRTDGFSVSAGVRF
jgi:hypothetical protein